MRPRTDVRTDRGVADVETRDDLGDGLERVGRLAEPGADRCLCARLNTAPPGRDTAHPGGRSI
ncbi:hypothetical protein AB0I10_32040 [Streptomyces sp. NPDC050636]|uniref:hypothetical protein n=1 Tax=Streptomyces sp. NPDC050636 TaxID=3154510 RepID=UPI00342324A8